jgi:hypothetical protein
MNDFCKMSMKNTAENAISRRTLRTDLEVIVAFPLAETCTMMMLRWILFDDAQHPPAVLI